MEISYEKGLEMMQDIIEKVVKKFHYLKTEPDDLRQEAAIYLWKAWDDIFAAPSPKGYFFKYLDNRFKALYEKEHYQGLWSTYSYHDVPNGDENAGFVVDPYILKRREKCRNWYNRVKEDPEKYAALKARIRENKRACRARQKADPEKYAAYLAKQKEHHKRQNKTRYQRIKDDQEKYAEYRAKRKEYAKKRYERIKADPEKYEAYKAACRERSRAYYQAKKENNGRGVKV